MKYKLSFFLLAFLFSTLAVCGQEVRESHFRLVYIDHEEKTDVYRIQQRLDKLRDDANDSGTCLVVYLANEDQPLISFTNLADPDTTRYRDTEEAYYDLIRELQDQPVHGINAQADLDSLKWLFGSGGIYPLFGEQDGKTVMNFESVTLDFYIGPYFWNLHCNEDLLAELFLTLKLSEYLNSSEFPPTKLSFNVMKPRDIPLMYSQGKPYGRKNLGGINDKTEIKEY